MMIARNSLRQHPVSFLWYAAYNLLINLLALLLIWRSRSNPKLRKAFEGRRQVWSRLERALAKRRWEKPMIWFHVASAGEWLQAQPVIRRCVKNGAECVLTYSSINARRWFDRQAGIPGELLAHDFLTLDRPSNALRLLALIQPSRIVWVSYDLWPNLVWEAYRQGVPQLLISGIVHASSLRNTSFLGRRFYRTIYRCLDGILVVSEADRDRIARVVPGHHNLLVMGDTRFDSVIERRERLAVHDLPDGFGKGTLFVAGSTWPKDEDCIFPVLKEALRDFPKLQLILVPHEPSEEHLIKAEDFFHDIPLVRWKHLDQGGPELRIILVDSIGLLAGMYRGADLAYVGAGFTTGVHNTMEPASMGLPVFFGPRYDNALEAIRMVEQGIAFSIRDSVEFRSLLRPLLEDLAHIHKLGSQARQFIESQAGASELCLPLILQDLE